MVPCFFSYSIPSRNKLARYNKRDKLYFEYRVTCSSCRLVTGGLSHVASASQALIVVSSETKYINTHNQKTRTPVSIHGVTGWTLKLVSCMGGEKAGPFRASAPRPADRMSANFGIRACWRFCWRLARILENGLLLHSLVGYSIAEYLTKRSCADRDRSELRDMVKPIQVSGGFVLQEEAR